MLENMSSRRDFCCWSILLSTYKWYYNKWYYNMGCHLSMNSRQLSHTEQSFQIFFHIKGSSDIRQHQTMNPRKKNLLNKGYHKRDMNEQWQDQPTVGEKKNNKTNTLASFWSVVSLSHLTRSFFFSLFRLLLLSQHFPCVRFKEKALRV